MKIAAKVDAVGNLLQTNGKVIKKKSLLDLQKLGQTRLQHIRDSSKKMLLAVRSPLLSSPHALKSPFSCLRDNLKAIKRHELHLTEVLGTGGFGTVHKGIARGEQVAVKFYHKSTKNKEAQVQSFRAELSILHFKHDNIVRLLSASSCDSIEKLDQEAFLVMEYVGSRNLASIIHSVQDKMTSEQQIKHAKDIVQALTYIHSHGIVHLDLKPANVLLTPSGVCKLGDFGCCQKFEKEGSYSPILTFSHVTGTYAYRAPELLRGQPSSSKADIFSLGIILWEISTQKIPYASENQHVVIFGVVAKNLRPDISDKPESLFDQNMRDLYCQCWAAYPLQRPNTSALLYKLTSFRSII